MKTAILFSGSIRDFGTCLPSIKRYLLDNLNADVFLHLWKMENISSMDVNVRFKWRPDSINEQFVIDTLKPTRYVIDTYSSEWESTILNASGIDMSKFTDDVSKNYGVNACGMYYKIYKTFELMEEYCTENNFQYDLVMRARLDFIWEDHVKLNDFVALNDQTIYLVKDRYATNSRLNTNDKYFAGSFAMMKKVCNLFNCISKYQSMGIMVEGQKLNEIHIKTLGLYVRWIGHSNTYYKCMGRHRIKCNKHNIIINNDTQMHDFWYKLSYELLYNGYNIVYVNNEENSETNILKLFDNFKFYDKDKITNLPNITCYISSSLNSKLNTIQQIIINYAPNSGKNECNAAPNNRTTFINVTSNISSDSLNDFVISIIRTGKFGNKYFFDKMTPIYNLNQREPILFKYMDHGYYRSNISSYDPDTKLYVVTIGGKTHHKNSRKTFKIIDLVKYCDRLEENCMPTN